MRLYDFRQTVLMIIPLSLYLIVPIVALWSPLLAGVVALILAGLTNSKHFLFLGLIFIVLNFIMMNLNKGIVSDLFWYSQQYLDNLSLPISDVFNDVRYGVQPRSTEPVYHLFSYLLSNLTNSSYPIFVVFVTTVIYLLPLISICVYLNYKQVGMYEVVCVIVFMLFFGIIFTQSLHLIRQYFACVFILTGSLFLVTTKEKSALFMFILSALTHNSMVILVVLFLGCYYYFKHKVILNAKSLIARCFAIGIVLASMYITAFVFILPSGASRLLIDDGSVGLVVKVVDLLILTLSVLLYLRTPALFTRFLPIYLIYLSFCCFLIVLHYSSFLSLRYYFVLDFFRWVGFFVILQAISLRQASRVLILFFMIIAGVVYLYYRVEFSPFDFNYSVVDYLLGDYEVEYLHF